MGTNAAGALEGAGVEEKDTVGVLEAVMPLGVALVLELTEGEGVSWAEAEGEALADGSEDLALRADAVAWESRDTVAAEFGV